MDYPAIITVVVLGIAFVVNVILGAVVFLQDPQKPLNRSFFALVLAASVWVFTNLLFEVSNDQPTQFAVALLSYGAAGSLSLSFLLYCLGLARKRPNRGVTVLIWAIGIAATIASMVPGYIANSVTADSRIMTNSLPLAQYGMYLLIYMGAGIIILLKARAKARGIERDRLTIVLLGLLFAAIVGIFFNLVLPSFGNYAYVDIGPVATLILAASSTYAIVKHQLFDIKLAAVRTVAYTGSLLTLSAVYYLAAYLASIVLFRGEVTNSIGVSPVNILLALLLAFLFQPIKRFFDRVTDDIFYRDRYETAELFAQLSRLLASTTDLRGLLGRTSQEIASMFKASQAFFFLYYTNTATHHMSAGTSGHATLPVHDAGMLDEYATATDGKVFLTDLLEDGTSLKRMLISHRIGMVVPLRRGDAVIGYIVLGERQSGNYTKRDQAILSTISNQLVIAIQNALSLHEVKELNATLQQRIDVATKELRSSNAQLKHLDETKNDFISMASHQLRTPLTSVKGYISMVLEGDAGKISAQQRKLLTEAFNSSERMVRLIADFLNVSRLQTGKFMIEKTPIDIKEIVLQETEDLKIIAKTHGLKLRVTITNKPLIITADESKIHQVVMNFIDNAIYYSHPNSTIVVDLDRVKDSVAFTVVDTGIGVPAHEQAQLFTKFFRAGNARKQRPDGTGVGLYLARRIIHGHGGAIIFSSHEGKGSTFGFRLPLDEPAKK